MADVPPPPPGFVLEGGKRGGNTPPPPPPGFVLEGASQPATPDNSYFADLPIPGGGPGYVDPNTPKPVEWREPGAIVPIQFNTEGGARLAMPSMLSSAIEGLQAPGKAWNGEYDEREVDPITGQIGQFDPRMMDDATNLASMVTMATPGARAPLPGPRVSNTVEGLKSEATSLYEAARKSGAVLPQDQSAQMAASMRNIAAGEGIITPTGRINESYTKLAALIRSFDDYGTGALTVDQMQSVRRLIGNALKSTDSDERRIAMEMMEAFHGYLDPISPQIAQANQIYHRAMNSESIETLIDLARQKSGQYGRSFDATLREQFGDLERQIIRGQVRGYSPEEIEAISKVAQGGNVENFLQWAGRFTASNPLASAGSFGVPAAAVTGMTGDPTLGTMAGLLTLGAGAGARVGASGATMKNARLAAALALDGAPSKGTIQPPWAEGSIPKLSTMLLQEHLGAPAMQTAPRFKLST